MSVESIERQCAREYVARLGRMPALTAQQIETGYLAGRRDERDRLARAVRQLIELGRIPELRPDAIAWKAAVAEVEQLLGG